MSDNEESKKLMDQMFETFKSSNEFKQQFKHLSDEEQEQVFNRCYDGFKDVAKLVLNLNKAIEELKEFQKLDEWYI